MDDRAVKPELPVGQIALVTRSESGIGKGITTRLRPAGPNVVALDNSNAPGAVDPRWRLDSAPARGSVGSTRHGEPPHMYNQSHTTGEGNQ